MNRLVIAQAILHIEANSCVRFAPKTSADKDFVHFHTSSGQNRGCYAEHYDPGKGQHSIHLETPGCMVTLKYFPDQHFFNFPPNFLKQNE